MALIFSFFQMFFGEELIYNVVLLSGVQPQLNQLYIHIYPDVQAGFRKSRGRRDQFANIRWIMEKAKEFQKNIYFGILDYAKAFDCVDHY